MKKKKGSLKNLLAGKGNPLDFILLAPRWGIFFPGKSIIDHKPLKRCQLVAQKQNKPSFENLVIEHSWFLKDQHPGFYLVTTRSRQCVFKPRN